MSIAGDDLPVQVTHIPGITRVRYTNSNKQDVRLVTAGEDHLVRLLPSEPTATDVIPLVMEDATQNISWIEANNKYLVTASEDGAVRLYQHALQSEDDPQKATSCIRIVRREVLPVRCVSLERATESPRAAICSDELIIRVANVEDPRQITLLTGHTRGVRAASWSPILPLLVSCGSDGDIRVWDMSSSEGSCVKVISNQLPALRPESEYTSLACWHPSGRLLAIPLKTKEIGLFNAPEMLQQARSPDMWCMVSVLSASSGVDSAEYRPSSGSISALEFCPNGRYLAVATEDNRICIWAIDSQKVVRAHATEALVTGLSWHPSKDVLAWTDTQGQLTRWETVLGSNMPSPCEDIAVQAPVISIEGKGVLDHELDDLFNDTPLDDDQAEEPQPKRMRMSRGTEDVSIRQSTFQPSSTPMIAQRRYLGVSTLGTLTSVDQDTHQTIVFESYDTSARRNFRFTDHFGYSLASMAAQGILFACESEAENPSVVFYRPFDDIPGVQTEWSISLPPGENATALALGGVPNVGSLADMRENGSGLVDESRTSPATSVVATSRGMLRFFGPSGMQRYVWALGAPVVTLAANAHGALVVYQAAPSTTAQTFLAYLLVEFSQWCIMQQGPLPLGPDSTLTWAGMDELGTPAIFDSMGMLYTLDRAWRPGQGRWVPALDTQLALQPKSADAETTKPRVRCWPIGITATHLLALLLPTSQLYPQPSGPRPLVQELELSLYMAQRDSTATPLEELALRRALLAGAIRDARAATGLDLMPKRLSAQESDPVQLDMEADKALLQIVQLACKADRYARALDASRALHSEATLEAALKIAHFFHLPSLADRMEQIRAPLIIHQQFQTEMVERSCGTDALLRNIARMQVPAPTPAPPAPVLDDPRTALRKDGFGSRTPRASSSVLAREGLAHQQQMQAPTPSMTSSDWLPPSSSLPSAAPSPAPPTEPDEIAAPSSTPPVRMNPFARTHSIARERHLHKSTSFFERVDATAKRKDDTDDADRTEKRSSSSRQSTLASFAYKDASQDA